ncbi:hypothetical protein BBJ28_00015288 [Nothophytophthora sp. Chile5]|nr:hypothetical protein BBJ28_00015288 [Nothophytophthora sp. Chile5]
MVSMLPATRTDAQQLQETFDQLLEQHQARAQAICPVREKFFLQVYEELIREVACECPERGLLLLRMRDELRLTIEAYQTLYHNSIAYGRQKAVQAEGGVGELEGEIHRLEAEREQLIATKRELTHKVRVRQGPIAWGAQSSMLTTLSWLLYGPCSFWKSKGAKKRRNESFDTHTRCNICRPNDRSWRFSIGK